MAITPIELARQYLVEANNLAIETFTPEGKSSQAYQNGSLAIIALTNLAQTLILLDEAERNVK